MLSWPNIRNTIPLIIITSAHAGDKFTVKAHWGILCVNNTVCLLDFPWALNKNENLFIHLETRKGRPLSVFLQRDKTKHVLVWHSY